VEERDSENGKGKMGLPIKLTWGPEGLIRPWR